MNEKEKMLCGKLYNSTDSELVSARARAKLLCFEYNSLSPDKQNEKTKLIKSLFYKTGENFIIEPNLFVDYGYNIEIGENFYSNHNLVILDCAKVTIGNNVLIGPNCGFYTAEHPLEVNLRNKGLEYARPISIGNNVWLGGGVTVLSDVTIGDNVVIGAGSVVTKNIPENSIAVGNPCKVIKKL